jgi:predicted ATPase/class 3 adenylate cyclase
MTGLLPSGTVTFLLTDLEGSTRLWESNPEAMTAAMVRHDELLDEAITAHRGFVFARMGDGMAASFFTAGQAVAAAVSFHRALTEEQWATASPLRARIGIHTDEGTVVNDNNYVNQPVNRAARLMAAAHGGQVVVSGATESLVRDELPIGTRLTDLGEHRLRDLGQPMRVFQLTHDGQSDDFPPLRTMDTFPGNLPAQVSSFIGRESAVAKVAAALTSSRIVTITGVGGVGKTRLSLQVAADVLPRYRDGAWLVELAPVRDPDGVIDAVAAVFGHNRTGPSLVESLVEMLLHKKVLLVLDNCEHVLGATAELVSTIERVCPGVAVLATSREGMAIDGEQLIALPPLDIGKPGEETGNLLQTDAVSLFVERARRVKADFELTQDNADAVVEICRRLDGVPLAIELGAARTIALSPAELLHRLDRRFQLLAGGRRGAVERHATLRAAIDWSYELLDPAEQRLLARASVFSGGATFAAIEAICCGGPVDRDVVLDLVTRLVSRSLVVAEDRRDATRYRLLETIRQYGEERLTECHETEAMRTCHADYYADLSALSAENSHGPEQLKWVRKINVERENIRAALMYAIDIGNAALAVKLVASHPHRQAMSGYPMGDVLLTPAFRVLDLPGAENEPEYARVLVVAAHQSVYSGDYDTGHELCQQAAEVEAKLHDPLPGPRIEMDQWILRAAALLWSGDYTEGATSYARAAEIADSEGYPGIAAMLLSYSVNSMLLGGSKENEEIERAEEAVGLARRSRMPAAMVSGLNSLALAIAEREPARARALLRESVDLSTASGDEMSIGFLTACMVSGRLRDWKLTLALSGRSFAGTRWALAPSQVATTLAECARSFAETKPEIAGLLQGAAYSAFAQSNPMSRERRRVPQSSKGNFVLEALRETGKLVGDALGDQKRGELAHAGAAMSMDEAVSCALANIDPKLLSGPVSV